MTDLQPSDVGAPASTAPRSPRRWLLPLVAVTALALGGATGWMLADDDLDDPARAGDAGAAVTVGGAPLTDRQQEMVRVATDYGAAWRSTQVDAVVDLFAPNGQIESILYDDVFGIGDGALADRVRAAMNAFDLTALEPVAPALVDENRLYWVSTSNGNTFSTLLVFTETGPVEIVRHISLNS